MQVGSAVYAQAAGEQRSGGDDVIDADFVESK
jgi:molecular chaperone DnaK